VKSGSGGAIAAFVAMEIEIVSKIADCKYSKQ
jgi:hypothetical protein